VICEIQAKANCLLKSERCCKKRNYGVANLVVAVTSHLRLLNLCDRLPSCQIEAFIRAIESTFCVLEKIVKSTGNKEWICIVKEFRCLIEKLRDCKSSCNGNTPV
jgi:hypothetical protein